VMRRRPVSTIPSERRSCSALLTASRKAPALPGHRPPYDRPGDMRPGAATCDKGGLRPPPGPDELLFPLAAGPRGGPRQAQGAPAIRGPRDDRAQTRAIRHARRLSEARHEMDRMQRTPAVPHAPGAGHAHHADARPRVARRVASLRRPRSPFFSRKAMIPCSLHVSGVDDDGEHFH
jgi:hypothetical protein